MKVKLNGKDDFLLNSEQNLHGLLQSRGWNGNQVIVEINLEIVPRSQWLTLNLHENDVIEIISFVGGG